MRYVVKKRTREQLLVGEVIRNLANVMLSSFNSTDTLGKFRSHIETGYCLGAEHEDILGLEFVENTRVL